MAYIWGVVVRFQGVSGEFYTKHVKKIVNRIKEMEKLDAKIGWFSTKSFPAAVILQLEAEGRLKIVDKLAK